MTKVLLRIESPEWVAGCVWKKHGNRWMPERNACAPILRWVLDHPPAIACQMMANWLAKNRETHSYHWIPINDDN